MTIKKNILLAILTIGTAVSAVHFGGGNGDGSASASFVGSIDGSASIFGGGIGDGYASDSAPTIALGSSDLIDSDADGMPDTWEVLNGLNPAIDDSASDLDSDGMDNIGEFLFCTDPQDPNDATQLSLFVGAGAATITLSWPSVPGKTYYIETSTNLLDWSPAFSINGAPGSTTATTVIVDEEERYFLRIRVNE